MNNLLALVLFSLFVLAILALDLGLFQRWAHTPSPSEAMTWYAAWLGLAVLFNLGVWAWRGADAALQFLAGYLLELSLSADNVLVFALIFEAMAVPICYQHRVLFWGILGALVARAIFIFAGVELVSRFHWILYVFGVFLLVTGVRSFWQKQIRVALDRYRALSLVRRVIPLSPKPEGAAFFTRRGGRVLATPLFLALLMVETIDVLFAADSIPAVFSVTQDPFILYTSNIFAILGLRALYFLLAGAIARFRHLRVGLALVLTFLGVKMLLAGIMRLPAFLVPAVTCTILVVALVGSGRFGRKLRPHWVTASPRSSAKHEGIPADRARRSSSRSLPSLPDS